jgi:alpha-L-fucosidase 2
MKTRSGREVPHSNDSPDALEALPEVRRLIFEGKHAEAQSLAGETFFSGPHGMMYQPVGDLLFSFDGHDDYRDFYRDLNLTTAVATTKYTVDGVEYTRETFASAPDQVIIVRFSASRPGSITFTATMESPQQSEVTVENNELVLSGITSDHEGIPGKVRFQSITQFESEGGTVSAADSTVHIRDADAVTIRISIASNFVNYNDISADERARADIWLRQAENKPYSELLEAHISDYQTYFNRVELDLGTTEAAARPTNERIADFTHAADPQLTELFFQYGRYLLISSSRPGTQPANLQGIWNSRYAAGLGQ